MLVLNPPFTRAHVNMDERGPLENGELLMKDWVQPGDIVQRK